ncbi:MAG: MBL fold metallo-hydrolase [Chlamydiae bacterium]|nr:MBL fold metallo-hydrolase [Chlamydiota bacterium]
MKITFLGTRGEIKPKTRRHSMHAATLFSHGGKKIMIDCGDGWERRLKKIKPDFILLTHAHPDHAYGLKKKGAACPVFATAKTWKIIHFFPIEKRKTIKERSPFILGGIRFEAFPVLHSIRCPAVGFRITSKEVKLFYVPDVAWIPNLSEAFDDIDFYIGDGATLYRPMIRKVKGRDEIFGHATIRQQLTWCHKEAVPKMIITHCGSDLVAREKRSTKILAKYGREREVEVVIAYDGMEFNIHS